MNRLKREIARKLPATAPVNVALMATRFLSGRMTRPVYALFSDPATFDPFRSIAISEASRYKRVRFEIRRLSDLRRRTNLHPALMASVMASARKTRPSHRRYATVHLGRGNHPAAARTDREHGWRAPWRGA